MLMVIMVAHLPMQHTFDSFGIEHIPKEIKKLIENKNIITNIYRLQAYDSIKCRYFCIGFNY